MEKVIEDLKNQGWKIDFEDSAKRKYDGGKTADVKFYGLEKDGQGIYIEFGPVDYIIPDREEEKGDG